MEQDRGSRPQAQGRPTHYERLQVSPQAPAAVIRAAYRALAALHHPDRLAARPAGEAAAHPACNETMAALNAAYAVLGDPERRRAYDAWLQAAHPEPARRPPATVLTRTASCWQAAVQAWEGWAPRRQGAALCVGVCACAAVLVAGGSAWALQAAWRTERAVVQAWQAAQAETLATPATPDGAAPAPAAALPAGAVTVAVAVAVADGAGRWREAADAPAGWGPRLPVEQGAAADRRTGAGGVQPAVYAPAGAPLERAHGRGASRPAVATMLPGGTPLRLRASVTLSAAH